MNGHIKSHIKPLRLRGLPEALRRRLKEARNQRGWSQRALGERVGLPQTHLSGIETGRIVPRFDTLLEVARVLGFDLLMVPRSLVPTVQALVRDTAGEDDTERPLYASDDPGDEEDV